MAENSKKPIRDQNLWIHVRCAVCGADRSELITHDWQSIGGELYTFDLVRCAQCGLAYINPRLNRTALTGNAGGGAWHQAASVNRAIYRAGCQRLLGLLRTGSARPALLDVGCAYGDFMAFAEKQGFAVTGLEIDAAAGRVAQERGYNVFTDHLECLALPPATFDVVTLWDVIEHVDDPRALLSAAVSLLKPGGILFYHTGNAAFQVTKGRILARLRPGRGPNNVPFQHLYHFSPRTSRLLLDRLGHFDCVDYTHLDTLRYSRRSKYWAMKGYNEAARLLFKVGLPLWTSSLAVFARTAPGSRN
jgi:2-polyprenyl-3-methyl-5-hydroxy-6-metoxy-1,4-benzoquinol methylase